MLLLYYNASDVHAYTFHTNQFYEKRPALYIYIRFWQLSLIQKLTRNMSRPARKPTLWTLRKVSTRISTSMPRRLTRIDTFRLLWIFCFRNHYSIPLSTWNGMCRPGLACADCAGWSGSIHYAEAIMCFLRDGSYILTSNHTL